MCIGCIGGAVTVLLFVVGVVIVAARDAACVLLSLVIGGTASWDWWFGGPRLALGWYVCVGVVVLVRALYLAALQRDKLLPIVLYKSYKARRAAGKSKPTKLGMVGAEVDSPPEQSCCKG